VLSIRGTGNDLAALRTRLKISLMLRWLGNGLVTCGGRISTPGAAPVW